MSQPEIFRRCLHCGASSKPGELFCAQCGNALTREKSAQAEQSIPAPVESSAALAEEMASAGDTERLATQSTQSDVQPLVAEPEPALSAPPTAAVIAQPRPNPGLPSQRAALAARAAVENRLHPRAEKLRRVSSVVLDEAAHDSSLRFILVVVVLFVLFLVLLFLSKWMV
jgi:hypothetical protein